MIGRRKSRELAWMAPLAQLIVLAIFAGMFIPGVSQVLQALGVLVVGLFILAVIIFLVFLAIRGVRRTAPVDLHASAKSSVGTDYPWARTSTENGASVAALHRLRPNHLKSDTRDPLATAEIIKHLREVDWFQFEKVIEILYRKLGCTVTRLGGANPDGGIDLIIEREGEKIAIQCKQWRNSDVRIRGMREFLGAFTHAGIQRGIYITLHGYTGEARRLADQHNIEILDESGLAKLLEEADARFDSALLEALQDRRKFCPKCESEMVLRTAKKGPNPGRQFWGCSDYPRCRGIMEA